MRADRARWTCRAREERLASEALMEPLVQGGKRRAGKGRKTLKRLLKALASPVMRCFGCTTK